MCSPASFETAYVQRASPTEPIVVTCASCDVERVLAEHLARREVDEPLDRVARRERGLEHVVRPDHVHAHRPDRALEDGVDAGDAGAVDDVGRAARRRSVRSRRRGRRPGRTWKFGCSARVVPPSVSRWRLSTATISFVVDEPARERRADEAGAARDDDSLAGQRHAASLGEEGRYLGGMRGSHRVLASLPCSRSPCRRPRRRRGDVPEDHVLVDGRDAQAGRRGRCAASPRAEPSRARPSHAASSPPAAAKLFAPVPRSAVCTEIYGGPRPRASSASSRGSRSGRRSTAQTAATSSAGTGLARGFCRPSGVSQVTLSRR